MRRCRSLLCVLGIALLAFVVLPWAIAHDVSRTLTVQDRRVIEYVLRDTGVRADAARGATFDQQITIIRKVQDAVFRIAPKDIGIPLGHTREPADLEKAGGGLCYDR